MTTNHNLIFLVSEIESYTTEKLEGISIAVLAPSLNSQERLLYLTGDGDIGLMPSIHHLSNIYRRSRSERCFRGGYLRLTAVQWARLQSILATKSKNTFYARVDADRGVLRESNVPQLIDAIERVIDIHCIAERAGFSLSRERLLTS